MEIIKKKIFQNQVPPQNNFARDPLQKHNFESNISGFSVPRPSPVQMWGFADVMMCRCDSEDVKLWRYPDVKICRCVRMRRCEGVQMWRYACTCAVFMCDEKKISSHKRSRKWQVSTSRFDNDSTMDWTVTSLDLNTFQLVMPSAAATHGLPHFFPFSIVDYVLDWF